VVRRTGSEEAALDLGANNLVACTTTNGEQYLYDGEKLFEQFRSTTEEIARLSAKLPPERDTSQRIRRLYRKRSRRRTHAQKALIRDLVERLHDEGIATVYIGDLTGVIEIQPSPEINEKLENFWAFKQFVDQLRSVCEEYGIAVVEKSEAWTSQTCPECGEQAETVRHRETLTCPCRFEGHADLTAAETFLRRNTEQQVRPMARPVRFQWDNHEWRSTTDAPSIGLGAVEIYFRVLDTELATQCTCVSSEQLLTEVRHSPCGRAEYRGCSQQNGSFRGIVTT